MIAEPVPVWSGSCELGEGPVWVDDRVWFVDILAHRIHSFEPIAREFRTWMAPEAVGFVQPIAGGEFVAGLKSGLYRFDPATDAFGEISLLQHPSIECRINDGAVDRSGHLWFGTLDESESSADGILYRLDDDGQCRPRDDGYVVTNGPAFSPDGKIFYHTDTLAKTIYAFDLEPDGALTGKRVFARIEKPDAYPDGTVVDAEGCLWIGLFGGWGVERYAPTGERLDYVEFPCSRVTNLAFGGANLGTAFVTTARTGLSADELQREPDAGALFAFDTGTRGLPTPVIEHGFPVTR